MVEQTTNEAASRDEQVAMAKAKDLPNWHDDDEDDDYDDEDDVVFGEDNGGKNAAANSSANASKTTQNSSSGKDSAIGGGPSQTNERDTNELVQSSYDEPRGERRGGHEDSGNYNRGFGDGERRQGGRGYGGPREYNDRRQGGRDNYGGGGGYNRDRQDGGGYNRDRQDGGGYNRDRQDGGYEKPRYNNNRNYDRGEGGFGNDNYRGGDRENRGYQNRRENVQAFDKFDKDQINPNSNYRLYYQNDPEFFSHVIELEEAPFHFKIHLFQAHEDLSQLDQREEKTRVMTFLQSFGATQVHTQPITDRSGRGNNKLRILFEISEKAQAQALYEMIGVQKINLLPETEQKMQIYFLLPEEKFEKYGDEAAAKFHEEETRLAEEQKVRQQQQREQREKDGPMRNQRGNDRGGNDRGGNDRGGNDRGGNDRGPRRNNRGNYRDQQAAETGIKFGAQPPKFVSSKPKNFTDGDAEAKPEESHRQVTYQSMGAPAMGAKVQGQGEQIYDANSKTKGAADASENPDTNQEQDGETDASRGGRGGRGRRNDRKRGERGERPVKPEDPEEHKGWTKRESNAETHVADGEDAGAQRGGRGRGRGGQRKRYNQDLDKSENSGQTEGQRVEDGKQHNRGDKREPAENETSETGRGARGGRGRGRGGRGGDRQDDGERQEGGRPHRRGGENRGEAGGEESHRGGRGERRGGPRQGGRGGGRPRYNKDGEADGNKNDERPNMSYKNKGKKNDGAGGAVTTQQQPADARMKKQTSTVSQGSINSTNRFSAFQQ